MPPAPAPVSLEGGLLQAGTGIRKVRVAFVDLSVYQVAFYVDGPAALHALGSYVSASHTSLCANKAFFVDLVRGGFRKTFYFTFLRAVAASRLQAGYRAPMLARVPAEVAGDVEALVSAVPDVKEGDVMLFRLDPDGEQVELCMGSDEPLAVLRSREAWLALQNIFFDDATEMLAVKHGLVQALPDIFAGVQAAESGNGAGTSTPADLDGAFLEDHIDSMPTSEGMGIAVSTHLSIVDAPEYELRMHVLGSQHLHDPEYRVGDITHGLLRGVRNSLNSDSPLACPPKLRVYVELELGGRTVTTRPVKSTSEERNAVRFDGELFIFAYDGELDMTVKVRDQRQVQSILRGDPLIGEARLLLGPELRDGRAHSADLDLQRGAVSTGAVSLSYQLQEVPRAVDLIA